MMKLTTNSDATLKAKSSTLEQTGFLLITRLVPTIQILATDSKRMMVPSSSYNRKAQLAQQPGNYTFDSFLKLDHQPTTG
jgi:hypothetical protein